MLNLIVAAIVTAFEKLFSAGAEKFAKIGLKIALFGLFASFIMGVIDYFLSYLRSFTFNGIDGCTAYFINLVGFFPALGIFLQILSIGFLAKHFIHYLRDAT